MCQPVTRCRKLVARAEWWSSRAGLDSCVSTRPGERPRDELDEFIDELFGAATEEKPGRFDLLLIIAGVVLIAWARLLDGPARRCGSVSRSVVLGLALPVRAALRIVRLVNRSGRPAASHHRWRTAARRLASRHRRPHRRLRAPHPDVVPAGHRQPEARGDGWPPGCRRGRDRPRRSSAREPRQDRASSACARGHRDADATDDPLA